MERGFPYYRFSYRSLKMSCCYWVKYVTSPCYHRYRRKKKAALKPFAMAKGTRFRERFFNGLCNGSGITNAPVFVHQWIPGP